MYSAWHIVVIVSEMDGLELLVLFVCFQMLFNQRYGYPILKNRSVQFSCSVMSDSLWPHGLQQAKLPCPSPTPGACSNSCPLSQWCHPTILTSVVPFSSCLQSFPASGSFPRSRFFALGAQSIGASDSASVIPMSSQGWFPLELNGLISLMS